MQAAHYEAKQSADGLLDHTCWVWSITKSSPGLGTAAGCTGGRLAELAAVTGGCSLAGECCWDAGWLTGTAASLRRGKTGHLVSELSLLGTEAALLTAE